MIITNKLKLPQAFVSAVEREYEYKDKQYSVTTILKDIREILLTRRHDKAIEQDVADMIWLILGTAVHSILENSKEANTEFKEEHFVEDVKDGYKLSGQADLYNAETKTVTDYKTCSAWKVIYSDFDDYKKQLLMYAWAFRKMGFEVENGEIIAVMKDHNKTKSKTDASYPNYPVKTIKFKFTNKDFEDIEEFINSKFEEIKHYENIQDDELPVCSAESRFNSGKKYAVKKKGNKRALRVYDTEKEAQDHLNKEDGLELEIREGEDKKCLEYCSCNKFCNYYQERYGKVEE